MDYSKDAVLLHDIATKGHDENGSTLQTAIIGLHEWASEQLQTRHHHVHTRNNDHHHQQHENFVKVAGFVGDVLLNSTTTFSSTPLDFDFDSNGLAEHNDTDYEDWIPYSARPETYIVPILFGLIFVIGVLGNGALIGMFIRHRQLRNVPNMFVCSLAVGDILVIFFCVPFISTVYTLESWPYGVVVCKLSEYIKDVSIGVSVFTLTALSADRYFAIVDPMRKLTGRRANRVSCITITGIWIFSLVISLPSVIFTYVRVIDDPDSDRQLQFCYPFPEELGSVYPKVIVMFKFLVYYVIPLFFIATFYCIMANHLIKSTKNMPGETQGQGKQIQARKKVAKMILSFVVIFALCFLPSHIFLIWFYYEPDSEEKFNEFWNILRITAFCLGFGNSCLNPITLYCVSGTFRKHFNRHLFCCFCKEGSTRRRRAPLFACGCVSISNTAAPQIDGHRQGQIHEPLRGHALCRASTTNNSNGPGKTKKTTWDTQSSFSHQQQLLVLNHLNANNNHRQQQNGSTAIDMTIPMGLGAIKRNTQEENCESSSSNKSVKTYPLTQVINENHKNSSSAPTTRRDENFSKNRVNRKGRLTKASSQSVDEGYTMTSFIKDTTSPIVHASQNDGNSFSGGEVSA